ncbi:hypothetical protein ACFWFI_26245 [Streptomyces sp. NPDC060209]
MPVLPAEPTPARSLAKLKMEIRALVDGGLGSLQAHHEYERRM